MITAHESLRQCVEAMKMVDFADCAERPELWHKINAAQQVAEEVLKRPEQEAPEIVAYAVMSSTTGIHKLSIKKDSADRKAATWREQWPNNQVHVRGLVFADAVPVAPQPAAAPSGDAWVSVNERLPEPEVLVAVYSPPTEYDWPGSVNISLDCIDPNDDYHKSWLGHNNWYEEYCCVAKPEGSIGPSADAPYTHWHAIAPAPTATK